jgi:hypothetical protein
VPVTGQAEGQIVSTLWTIGPSYTVYHAHGASVDLLVGGQFLPVSGNANVQLTALGHTYDTSTSKRGSYGAVIVGAYGQFESGPNWAIPYSFAEGLGTPSSWQGLIGLRYHRVSLSWRYVQYNAGSSTSLVQRLSLGGPLIGYGFRF